MCGEGDPLCNPISLFQPAHILLDSPSLSIIIEPGVDTTFQYTFVDCAAVVGGYTYRYYILLRAGDMYALILDQEVEGK